MPDFKELLLGQEMLKWNVIVQNVKQQQSKSLRNKFGEAWKIVCLKRPEIIQHKVHSLRRTFAPIKVSFFTLKTSLVVATDDKAMQAKSSFTYIQKKISINSKLLRQSEC